MDKFESLMRFKELLDAGILTQEEFSEKKAELLGLPVEPVVSEEPLIPEIEIPEVKEEVPEVVVPEVVVPEVEVPETVVPEIEEPESKIDKFDTLYKKNEEFLKLLDEEYNKLKGVNETPVETPVETVPASETPVEETSKEDNLKTCPRCGTRTMGKFCFECGFNLSEPAPAPTVKPESAPAPAPTVKPESAPAEKKPKKTGAIIAIVVAAVLVLGGLAYFFLIKDGGNMQEAPDEDVMPTEISVDFKDANIFEFEKVSMERDSDGEDYISFFKAHNNGKDEVWSLYVDFQYVDEDDNELYESSNGIDGSIEGGKFAYLTSYSYLDGIDPDEVKDVKVKSYIYTIGDNEYEVNLQTQEVSASTGALEFESNTEFDPANIISFDFDNAGLEDDEYKVTVKVTNNGKTKVAEVYYDLEFYSQKGNVLEVSGSSTDSVLASGKSAMTKTYCFDYAKSVDKYKIVGYTCYLTEDDSNGFNVYEVNLVTKTAYGYHSDDL